MRIEPSAVSVCTAWGLLKPLRSGKHSRGGSRDLAARKDSAASSNKSGNGTAKSPHHAAHDSISSLQVQKILKKPYLNPTFLAVSVKPLQDSCSLSGMKP